MCVFTNDKCTKSRNHCRCHHNENTKWQNWFYAATHCRGPSYPQRSQNISDKNNLEKWFTCAYQVGSEMSFQNTSHLESDAGRFESSVHLAWGCTMARSSKILAQGPFTVPLSPKQGAVWAPMVSFIPQSWRAFTSTKWPCSVDTQASQCFSQCPTKWTK